jgi:hypothetical protein
MRKMAEEFISKIQKGELTLKQIQRFLLDNKARCWNCGKRYRGGGAEMIL